MKKVLLLTLSFVFLLSVASVPVWAGGGKVRGESGSGSTYQEGFDSQGNQAP